MRLTVELTGMPRSLVGKKLIEMDMPGTCTYRDILRRLAVEYPELVGLVIAPDRDEFLSSNMFVINGDLASPAMVLDEQPADGAHLVLLSVITGG